MRAAIINLTKDKLCSISEAAVFAEKELVKLGVEMVSCATINYNKKLFEESLSTLQKFAQLVVVLCEQSLSWQAKKQISDAVNDKLTENKFAKNFVTTAIAKGRTLEKEDIQNITLPEKARCILNKVSSHCGFSYESENSMLLYFPSDIGKYEQVIMDGISMLLETKAKKHSITLKTFGVTEEEIISLLSSIDEAKEHAIEVKVIEKFPECDVIIRYSAKTAKVVLDEFLIFVRSRLDEFVYGEGDETLSRNVIDMLETHKSKCSIVDGATLGELTKTIAKENTTYRCYVPHNTLYVDEMKGNAEQSDVMYNAVLEELKMRKCDYCLATFVDKIDKNAFYIVIGDKNNIHIFKEAYKNSVTSFEECVAKTALFYFMKKLKFGT